jgi:hypothetical protein
MDALMPSNSRTALEQIWLGISEIRVALGQRALRALPTVYGDVRCDRLCRMALNRLFWTRSQTQAPTAATTTALWGIVRPIYGEFVGGGGNSGDGNGGGGGTNRTAANYNPGTGATRLKESFGANLQGFASYTTQIPLLNVFPQTRHWVGRKAMPPDQYGWVQFVDDDRPLLLDANGWVKALASNPEQRAETLIFDGHTYYPAGEWVILYDGEGDIQTNHPTVSTATGRIVIDVTPGTQGIVLTLSNINPANYLRNIRLIQPGKEQEFLNGAVFDPTFIQILTESNLKTLRFMDWAEVNHDTRRTDYAQLTSSADAQWSSIPHDSLALPDETRFGVPPARHPNYTLAPLLTRGAPIAAQIAAATAADTNAWITIPLRMTDAAVQAIAEDWLTFNPNKLLFLELSNEVWNYQFWQTSYAYDAGTALGFTADREHLFYAKRSVEIFKIFETVFGGLSRLRRVVCSQGVLPYIGEQILNYTHPVHGLTKNNVDYCAAALYFSGSHQWINKPFNAEHILSLSDDAILDWMYDDVTIVRTEGPGGIHDPQYVQPSCRKMIADHAAMCVAQGVAPAMYEGGPHLQAIQFPEARREAITAKFIAINNHPRMEDVTWAWLKTLDFYGIEPACYFSFAASIWDQYGMWSVLNYQLQPYTQSPKMQGIKGFQLAA